MPHVTGRFDILDFEVRNRGFKMRVPVDQPLAAIDEAFVVHLDKDFDDRIVEIAIGFIRRRARGTGHGKGCAVKIAARAKTFELIDDRATGLGFPFPDFFKEFIAPKIAPTRFAVFRQAPLDNHLRRDARVVCAGLPERVKALHPFPTDQNILQRIVERVAHVQHTCHIGRRDHDAIGRGTGLGIRPCGKTTGLFPSGEQAAFRLGCVKGFFHRHDADPACGLYVSTRV